MLVQFVQVAHPPKRRFEGRVPRVHRGFLNTWTRNGINHRVLTFVQELLASRPLSHRKVLTCGHSLGGAVATLAAFDISRISGVEVPKGNILCYTFGCPRVGNHAFADEYASAVPDTWHIINKQDTVARAMKLGGWCAPATVLPLAAHCHRAHHCPVFACRCSSERWLFGCMHASEMLSMS